jgi:hypothetical protein
MNDMPSISIAIAHGPHQLLYLNFLTATGNILPFKNHHPALLDTDLCDRIGMRNLSNYFNEHIDDSA